MVTWTVTWICRYIDIHSRVLCVDFSESSYFCIWARWIPVCSWGWRFLCGLGQALPGALSQTHLSPYCNINQSLFQEQATWDFARKSFSYILQYCYNDLKLTELVFEPFWGQKHLVHSVNWNQEKHKFF